MPANLTPEAKAKWNKALAAKNPKEKIQAFQEFLSAMPKHKGNERLQAQVKTKIAALKEELALQRKKRAGGYSPWSVEREGAAQVLLFGPTNAGRSSLLRALTKAQPVVASYEYTTQRPVPGMLQYEDVQFQLIELPAPQASANGQYEIQHEVVDVLRTSDGIVLVLDLSANPSRQFDALISALKEVRISIERQVSRVQIIREKGSGEIRIASSAALTSSNAEQIRELLHGYGVRNALVRIYGDVSIDDVEDAILENVTIYKPSLIVANKVDLPAARPSLVEFRRQLPQSFAVIPTSCLTGEGLGRIGEEIFRCLGIIRVYTKEPYQSRPSEFPFVVPDGTTVKELARRIHTDLADRYRYSRLWGPTSKFAGERVGPDHVLGDRDVVEIHTA